MLTNNFIKRHNGPRESELRQMLDKIGVASIDALIDETIPKAIRLKEPMNLPKGLSEYEYLNHIKAIGAKNKLYKSYIGMGYYNTITPGVITRNILENPGWYTSYTPYQAEISQGRLEALLNFQTMVADLTALPLANASLLDEATAAAEAMIMLFNGRPRAQAKAGATYFINKFKTELNYTGNVYSPMRLPLTSSLDPRIAESPWWSTQNIQINYKGFKRWEIYTGVKNILNFTPNKGNPFIIARANDPFDKNIQTNANGEVIPTADNPYALTFDPTYIFAPNQGARVFLGIRFKID